MSTPSTAEHYDDAFPLAALLESPSNYRKTFTPKPLDELAASIKSKGVIQPIVIRPLPSEDPRIVKLMKKGVSEFEYHEVVVGGRRTRASKMAGRETIPARIVNLSDEEVYEFQLIENIQREDPHPLQEAEGMAALIRLDPVKHTPDNIALRISKDRSHVYKRLQLVELCERAKAAFMADEIQIGHALEICRLGSEKDQVAALGFCYEYTWKGQDRVPNWSKPNGFPVLKLREAIADRITRKLSAAPWKKDDVTLVPSAGACTTCPKRSGSNLQLFEDMKATDICTDSECFEAKRTAFVNIQFTAAKKDGRALVTLDWNGSSKTAAAGVIPHSAFTLIAGKSDRCSEQEDAIVVAGDRDLGHAIKICRSQSCKVHSNRSYNVKATSPAEEWKIKRKQLDGRIDREVKLAGIRAIADAPGDPNQGNAFRLIGRRLIDLVGNDARRELVAAFSAKGEKPIKQADFENHLVATLNGTGGARLIHFLLALCALPKWGDSGPQLKSSAELVKVDLTVIRKRVAGPMIGTFEARKKKALAAEKGKKAVKVAQGKVGAAIAAGKTGKPMKGVCRFCGCGESTPCISKQGQPCAWMDNGKTLCSNAACVKAAAREKKTGLDKIADVSDMAKHMKAAK